MAFIWGQFHKRHPSHQSLKLAWKLLSEIQFKTPGPAMRKAFPCHEIIMKPRPNNTRRISGRNAFHGIHCISNYSSSIIRLGIVSKAWLSNSYRNTELLLLVFTEYITEQYGTIFVHFRYNVLSFSRQRDRHRDLCNRSGLEESTSVFKNGPGTRDNRSWQKRALEGFYINQPQIFILTSSLWYIRQ